MLPRIKDVVPKGFASRELLPTKDDIAAGQQYLQQHHAELALIKQAAALPACGFVRNWQPVILAATPYRELIAMRQGARLLSIECQILALQGKYEEAASLLATGFRMARHAGSEPFYMAYLVRQSIEASMLSTVWRLLYLSGGDPQVAARVRRTVDQEWKPTPLARIVAARAVQDVDMAEFFRASDRREMEKWLRGDESSGSSIFSAMQKMDDATWRKTFSENEAVILNRGRRTAEVVEKPYWKALPTLQQVHREFEGDQDERHRLAQSLTSDPTGIAWKRPWMESMVLVVRCAAAVLEWKGKHGGYPVSLEQAMKSAPLDPFDGKPLRYRREGKGFVIFSVGKDGAFGGGSPTVPPKAGEIVFRFPHPAYPPNAAGK
jgi:hypothetical protein